MVRSNFGAVRLPLLGAAVLASFAVSLSAQVVEKGRTYADLVATHPCNSGNSGRLARVTDAQSSSSIGGGGGSTQVWAVCNGVDTWTLTTIGGSGGGVSGLTSCADGTALADNSVMRADGTTGCQGSGFILSDVAANSVTLSSITGTAIVISATAPAATTGASQAGKSVGITASAAVASTDTAGAAAGGSVTITSGAAARNTSGNANGGDINLVTGAGIGTGTAGQVVVPGGTAAAPGIALSGATNTGIQLNAGALYVSIGGGSAVRLANDATRFVSNADVGWTSSTTDTASTATDTGLKRNAAGVLKITDGGTGIRGFLGGGAAVASATAMPVPTGRVFHVTGTTNITSITATNLQSGVCITLIFDDVLTFTDGNNLKLAGDFVTTADDTWHGCYDGTNFYEEGRSIN